MFFTCFKIIFLAHLVSSQTQVVESVIKMPHLIKIRNPSENVAGDPDVCVQYRKYDMAEACKLHYNYNGFMRMVEYYLRKQSSLIDTTTCPQITPDKLAPCYDFIVVGAGTAGSVVARRLADANFTVLLLEAGKPAPVGMQVPSMYGAYNGNPDVDWYLKSAPQKNVCLSTGGICAWPRGKVIGGTSCLNAQMYMRGYQKDYDDYNMTGWMWKDMFRIFRKSEDNLEIGKYADEGYHNRGGYLTVSRFRYQPPIIDDILAAADQLGYRTRMDLNGKDRIGFSVAQATTRNGERLTTARAYIYDAPTKARTLQVIDSAYVTKVIFNQDKKAIGVEYERNGRMYTIKSDKEVIITAGALKSPQILLLSGIGPRKHLEKIGIPVLYDLPGVGQNLHNHASFHVYFKVKNDSGVNLMNANTLKKYIENREGPLTAPGLSQLTGFIHTKYANPETDPPDLQFFFGGFRANCSKDGKPSSIEQPRYISMDPTILVPKSIGYLELHDQYPKSPPKIEPRLYSNEHDLNVLLEGINVAIKLSETQALKNILEIDRTKPAGCIQYEFGTPEFWKCSMRYNTATENHQVGTCKMGYATDRMAVTDPKLSVYGVRCLRVMDLSVLPAVPRGNTQAPAIAVGENGAEMVIDYWLNHMSC